MAKSIETQEMELAVEAVATSKRRQFFGKNEVISYYIKKHPAKQQELRALEDLDRRILEEITPEAEARGSVYRDRELARLSSIAGRILHTQYEEDFGQHRRFGCYQDGADFKWFEVRYARVRFLRLWRDVQKVNVERCGLRVADTDIILEVARAHATDNINKIYPEAMRLIANQRRAA